MKKAVNGLVLLASCFLMAAGNICVDESAVSDDEQYASIVLLGKYKQPEQLKKLELIEQHLQDILKPTPVHYLDCEQAYEQGERASGVYTIQPDSDKPFEVYCDMDTDSGGWTVFQRRINGSVDFYRDWMDYARGFGELKSEFWLGLRKIHRITALSASAGGNELRVDLQDFEDNTAYAKYTTFYVGSASTGYQLTTGGYSGTAGNSLGNERHNGYRFSTKDRDNDVHSASCAQLYKGAWWYAKCHNSNLNGVYLGGRHSSYADGVEWFHWKGHYYSLKGTEMKVRRQ